MKPRLATLEHAGFAKTESGAYADYRSTVAYMEEGEIPNFILGDVQLLANIDAHDLKSIIRSFRKENGLRSFNDFIISVRNTLFDTDLINEHIAYLHRGDTITLGINHNKQGFDSLLLRACGWDYHIAPHIGNEHDKSILPLLTWHNDDGPSSALWSRLDDDSASDDTEGGE